MMMTNRSNIGQPGHEDDHNAPTKLSSYLFPFSYSLSSGIILGTRLKNYKKIKCQIKNKKRFGLCGMQCKA